MLPNAAFGIEMRLPPRSPTVRKMALLARFHRPIGSSAFPPDAGPSLTHAGCRPWVNSSQLSDRKAAPFADIHGALAIPTYARPPNRLCGRALCRHGTADECSIHVPRPGSSRQRCTKKAGCVSVHWATSGCACIKAAPGWMAKSPTINSRDSQASGADVRQARMTSV